MSSALRTKILDAKDIKTERLEVPAWGCTLEIRGLTAARRGSLVERATVVSGKDDEGHDVSTVDSKILNPLLIIASCFDPETGEQVFEETDAEGIDNKSSETTDLVTSVILRLNGMAKKDAKALEKNSGATDTAAGPSA